MISGVAWVIIIEPVGRNNDERNDQKEARDQGPDVQALGSGGVGLGTAHITCRPPVPRLPRVGD